MDDDNLVQGAIPYGYRCQHNKVLYKEIWEAEDIKAALDDDNRTMQVIVDLVKKNPWYRLGRGCSRAFCSVCYWAKGKGI